MSCLPEMKTKYIRSSSRSIEEVIGQFQGNMKLVKEVIPSWGSRLEGSSEEIRNFLNSIKVKDEQGQYTVTDEDIVNFVNDRLFLFRDTVRDFMPRITQALTYHKKKLKFEGVPVSIVLALLGIYGLYDFWKTRQVFRTSIVKSFFEIRKRSFFEKIQKFYN
jgi:hypothetical protein